jgi:hypothetical protein
MEISTSGTSIGVQQLKSNLRRTTFEESTHAVVSRMIGKARYYMDNPLIYSSVHEKELTKQMASFGDYIAAIRRG